MDGVLINFLLKLSKNLFLSGAFEFPNVLLNKDQQKNKAFSLKELCQITYVRTDF